MKRSYSLGSYVSGCRLLCNEKFGFRTKHSCTLHLDPLVESASSNVDEKMLTDVIFLDVAKVFNTV